ncbi:MAG: diguanylate cyclase [Campylobacterales bacterium]|nr:diguanylate cyclase [Campylobacterales bacterium]
MSKQTLLVVDDEIVNIKAIAKILDDNYILKVAKDGLSALEVIQSNPIDLILLDIIMPKMNGYELAKILKHEPRFCNIPFIFLTAKSDTSSIIKGFELGAVDYISKPFVKEELLARVNVHLQNYILHCSLEKHIKKLEHYAAIMDEHIISSSTDLEGNIIETSKAFERVSGYLKDELIGKQHNILKDSKMNQEVYRELWDTITQDKIRKGEIRNQTKEGVSYWTDTTILPEYDDEGIKIGYTAIRQNITAKKKIEEISIRDELTGLFNRRHFNKIFEDEINRAKRAQSEFIFMMLDVDHFKKYNDHYGHQEGDNALHQIGKVLQEHSKRSGDYPFRLGGEEFGFISQSQSKTQALKLAEDIRSSVEALQIQHIHNSKSGYITLSIGLFFRKLAKDESTKSIYKETDELLYRAKESGRNRVCL